MSPFCAKSGPSKSKDIKVGLVESTILILYLGRRVTVVNSVLDSLPTYVMSLFPIPASVVNKLNRLTKAIREGEGVTIQ